MSLDDHYHGLNGEEYDAFLEKAYSSNYRTPDLPKILEVQNHLIFTYGTLKTGRHRNSLLNHCEYIGNAVTTIIGYNLLYYTKGRYPIALPVTEEKKVYERAPIYGEVYLVPASTIPVLDSIEANGEMFNRKRRYVLLSSSKYGVKRPILPVWMYEGHPDYWYDTAIKDKGNMEYFFPCKLITPQKSDLGKFYNF